MKSLLVLVAAGIAMVAAADERVYRVGQEGVKAPKVVHQVEPQFTEKAREAGISGSVLLSLEVSPEGKAENIKVMRGLEESLDQAAMDALKKWQFEPGKKPDGTAVRVYANIEVHFRRK